MTVEPLTLSRPEAARALGISVPTLDRRLRDGEILSVRVGGRRLIPRDAIDAVLQPDLIKFGELFGDDDEGDIIVKPNYSLHPAELAVFAERPGLTERMQETARRLAANALAAQGDDACHNTRRAVALHEAGHAVVCHLEGRTVARVAVSMGADGVWRGYSHTPDIPTPGISSISDEAAFVLSIARQHIAGVASEGLFLAPATGSEIREQVLFLFCCEEVANGTGRPVADVVFEQTAVVDSMLLSNRDVVLAIAARLEADRTLNQAEIAELLEAAHA